MEIFIAFFAFVFGVLQIILFFKIWGMTNDVADIKELLIQQSIQSHSNSESSGISSTEKMNDKEKFYVGQLVVLLSTEEQMKIMEVTPNGYYACYTNSGSIFHGKYTAKEIEDFDTYWNKKKGIR